MKQTDAVDILIAQWEKERPDLDPKVMGVFGRLAKVYAHMTRAIEETLQGFGLQMGEFDVLAAVRRSGAPFIVAPSQLTRLLMLSPSGITSRLDRLEQLGYIERQATREDRRSLLVVLTAAGKKVVDEAVTAHVANETRLLKPLRAAEYRSLDQALRTLLGSFEHPSTE